MKGRCVDSPVVLPQHVDACVERRYFSDVHRLALVCAEPVLDARLRARPKWRGASDPDVLAQQLEFNASLKRIAERERMELVDTTSTSIEETADRVLAWMIDRV